MENVDLPFLDPQKGHWDEQTVSRRQFLEAGFWSITGAVALVIGGISVRFLVGNSMTGREGEWVTLGNISDLPPGKMHRLIYSYRTKDQWRDIEQGGVLYVFSEDGVVYTALDATCTHLGCNVHWKEDEDQFSCPCHKGHYTRSGEVISGPPPRPLRVLKIEIQDGVLAALI